MEDEIWKVYKETRQSVWEVSNYGSVKRNGKLYEPYKLNGYLVFHVNGKKILVHRAVAELFIPNCDNKPCIDHINTNCTDNRVENLRWVTYTENMNNPITKLKISEAKKGKKHSEETKLKISYALKGKKLSDEHKQKLSNLLKGKNRSEETKQKMSNYRKGKHWKLIDGKRVWY